MVPSFIEASNGWLWNFDHSGSDEPMVTRGGPGILEGFVRLADAADSRIESFAKRWGVLDACISHDRPNCYCQPSSFVGDVGAYREKLTTWRQYATRAGEMLKAAAELRLERGIASGEWIQVRGHESRDVRGAQWEVLAYELRTWLAIGGVKVTIGSIREQPRGGPLRHELAPTGMLGAVALQLSLACAGAPGMDVCDECGEFFSIPPGGRRRQAGRRTFCPEHRTPRIYAKHFARNKPPPVD